MLAHYFDVLLYKKSSFGLYNILWSNGPLE